MLRPSFVEYALSPKADPALVGEVRTALKKFLNDLVTGPYKSHADAYLAYLPGYWWGCNQSKSEYGYRAMFAVKLGVNPAEDGICRAAAEDYLHFLHGRNPLCQVYLTNMGPKGADAGAGKSIMQPFHTWFAENSPWSGPNSIRPGAGAACGRAQRRHRRRGGARMALSARPRTALEGLQGLEHCLEPGPSGEREFLGLYRTGHLLSGPLCALALAVRRQRKARHPRRDAVSALGTTEE